MDRIRRAYVDTSVFGGCHDTEFCESSQLFFEQVKAGRFTVVVSQLTANELADAPNAVVEVLSRLPNESIERVASEADLEAEVLADAYIAAGILGRASKADATHVAIATVVKADLILSWNFRHIVNYERIAQFNRVNAAKGYPSMAIHSPPEVIYGDEDKDV